MVPGIQNSKLFHEYVTILYSFAMQYLMQAKNRICKAQVSKTTKQRKQVAKIWMFKVKFYGENL